MMYFHSNFQLFEDKEDNSPDGKKLVKYVCLVELSVLDMRTDGVGVWQEPVTGNGKSSGPRRSANIIS